MIDRINDHFSKLKLDFQNQFKQSAMGIRDSSELRNKIKAMLQELDLLNQNLNNDRMFDSFKNTSSLDAQTLIKYYDDLVAQELNKTVSLPTKVTLNEVAFNNYDQDLKNLVNLQKNEVRLPGTGSSVGKTGNKYLQELVPITEYFNQKFKRI